MNNEFEENYLEVIELEYLTAMRDEIVCKMKGASEASIEEACLEIDFKIKSLSIIPRTARVH